jgi:hypothetical protein
MRRSDFQPLVCWLAISVAVAGGLLTATPAGAEPQLSSHYQALAPGLDYAHIRMTNWTKAEPWSIHVARLDRSRKDLHLTSVLAFNAGR